MRKIMFCRPYSTFNSRSVSQSRLSKRWLTLTALCVMVVILAQAAPIQAQAIEKQWIGPRRLSTPSVDNAGEIKMAADQYGNLHMFWSESISEQEGTVLQYTVFDGEVWQKPIDIAASRDIGFYDALVDGAGTLHLVWTEGNEGPVFMLLLLQIARCRSMLGLNG